MGLKNLIRFILISGLLSNGVVFASWNGPSVVIQGPWGATETAFGFKKGETTDTFPTTIAVLQDGKILIHDANNKKIKIFNNSGQYIKSIVTPGRGFFAIDIDKVVSGKLDTQFNTHVGIYDLSAEQWLWVDSAHDVGLLPQDSVFLDSGKKEVYVWNNRDKGYHYSATGAVLETYITKPLIFGQEVSSQKLSDGNYFTVLKFNDATYGCKTPTPFSTLTRDISGFLYGEAHVGEDTGLHTRIFKITKCGKVIATVDFPPDKRHAGTFTRRSQTYYTEVVDEEYGQPVIAPNGDVYTWKRMPDTYSILKWTWVDDPNVPTGPDAPMGFSVMPSTTGLYLTWAASAQDPGCVTGYEIAQTTTSGGAYSTIATVNAGVLKYNDASAAVGTTYYYKIRAKAGTDYSPYTSEVSGKR